MSVIEELTINKFNFPVFMVNYTFLVLTKMIKMSMHNPLSETAVLHILGQFLIMNVCP